MMKPSVRKSYHSFANVSRAVCFSTTEKQQLSELKGRAFFIGALYKLKVVAFDISSWRVRIVERLLHRCECPWSGKLAIVSLGEVGECGCVHECECVRA